MSNTIRIGATQMGKSTAIIKDCVQYAERRAGGLLVEDPHSTMAIELAAHLTARNIPFLYEKLSDTKRFLPFQFLKRSGQSDPWAKLAENEESARAFADVLVRRRGQMGLQNTPLIEEWIMAALELWLNQSEHISIAHLHHCFTPKHPVFDQLVENCTDGDTKHKFKLIEGMTALQRRSEIGSAQRILRIVLRSAAFALRCDGDFDIGQYLGNGGILIIEGKSLEGGSISEDAIRTTFGAMTLQVIQHVFKRTEGQRIRIVMDEANNYSLVGPYETKAMAECQKMGLDFDIGTQGIDFPTPEVLDSVLTNCHRHEWFKAGSDLVALKGSKDLGIPTLDEYKVHHSDERVNRFIKDYEVTEINKTGDWWRDDGSTGGSTGTQIMQKPVFEIESQITDHYQSLNDQVMLYQRELMTIGVGIRFVKDGSGIRKEHVQKLGEPYPCMPRLKEKRTRATIERIRKSRPFRSSQKLRSPETSLGLIGEKETRDSSTSSTIPQPSSNGSKQEFSPITMLLQEGQESSNNENAIKSTMSVES